MASTEPPESTAAPPEQPVEMCRRAADIHDRFNIAAITPLVSLTVAAFARPCRSTDVTLSYSTFTYILVDIVYHLLVPRIQPSFFRFSTIMAHHLVTAWLLLHPILHPEHAHFTKYCTIVEINTLFLTMNKFLKWKLMQFGFYSTWVGMRLVWYPYLIKRFHDTMIRWGATPALTDYNYCQVVGSLGVLCGFNYVWTAEVVAKLLRNKKKNAAKHSEDARELLKVEEEENKGSAPPTVPDK